MCDYFIVEFLYWTNVFEKHIVSAHVNNKTLRWSMVANHTPMTTRLAAT